MIGSTSRSIRFLLAVFCIASVGLLAWSTRLDPGSLLLFPVFASRMLVPYGILWVASRGLHETRPQEVVFLVGTLLVGLFGISLFTYGFVTSPDPQSGLLLVFLPLWQLVGSGGTVGILALLAHRNRTA